MKQLKASHAWSAHCTINMASIFFSQTIFLVLCCLFIPSSMRWCHSWNFIVLASSPSSARSLFVLRGNSGSSEDSYTYPYFVLETASFHFAAILTCRAWYIHSLTHRHKCVLVLRTHRHSRHSAHTLFIYSLSFSLDRFIFFIALQLNQLCVAIFLKKFHCAVKNIKSF